MHPRDEVSTARRGHRVSWSPHPCPLGGRASHWCLRRTAFHNVKCQAGLTESHFLSKTRGVSAWGCCHQEVPGPGEVAQRIMYFLWKCEVASSDPGHPRKSRAH